MLKKVKGLGVFAPGDCYQGNSLLEGWLRKAGVSSIEEVWHKAKKGHRLWIFPIDNSTG